MICKNTKSIISCIVWCTTDTEYTRHTMASLSLFFYAKSFQKVLWFLEHHTRHDLHKSKSKTDSHNSYDRHKNETECATKYSFFKYTFDMFIVINFIAYPIFSSKCIKNSQHRTKSNQYPHQECSCNKHHTDK